MTSEETEKVKGPGRGHQYVRSVSAVVVALSAIAVALGVLTMAEEAIDHTDLMNDQNELLHRQTDLMEQQISHRECVDQLATFIAVGEYLQGDTRNIDWDMFDRMADEWPDCFSGRRLGWVKIDDLLGDE